MNDLDSAVREALALDALRAPDAPLQWDRTTSLAPVPRRPVRGWLLAAASLILVAGLATIVATSDGPTRKIVPGISTSTTDGSTAERARAEYERLLREAAKAAARGMAARRSAESLP